MGPDLISNLFIYYFCLLFDHCDNKLQAFQMKAFPDYSLNYFSIYIVQCTVYTPSHTLHFILLLRQFETRFYSVSEEVMKNVAERTGCQAPCMYTEFRMRPETEEVVSMTFYTCCFHYLCSDWPGETRCNTVEHLSLHPGGDRGVTLRLVLIHRRSWRHSGSLSRLFLHGNMG